MWQPSLSTLNGLIDPSRPRAKPAAPARKRRPAVPKHKDRAELVPESAAVRSQRDAMNMMAASVSEIPNSSPKPSRFDLLAVMWDAIDKPSALLIGFGFGLGVSPLVVYFVTK